MAFLLNRTPSRIAWALIALLVAAAGVRAEEPYSFAATPGKLPKTVVPIHYALDLAGLREAHAGGPEPSTSTSWRRPTGWCSTR
jgi:hypothetical protein